MSSSSLLFFNLLILLLRSSSGQICLWGGTTSSRINGEYTATGNTANGQPTFSKIVPTHAGAFCGVSPIYLNYAYNGASNYWSVYTAMDVTPGFARCETADLDTLDTNPSACDGNWSPVTDVYARSGACPAWDCNRVQLSYAMDTNHICNVLFDEMVAVNAWKGYSDMFTRDVYFYFNELTFSWYCSSEYEKVCNVTAFDAPVSKGFTDLSTGNSQNMAMSSGETITVNCLDYENPTSHPSSMPTNDPATDMPSHMPSSVPTNDPATNMPTNDPATSMPSFHPTTQPTFNPSHPGDTNSPSSPSWTPSMNPSMATAHPSSNPTSQPTQPTQPTATTTATQTTTGPGSAASRTIGIYYVCYVLIIASCIIVNSVCA